MNIKNEKNGGFLGIRKAYYFRTWSTWQNWDLGNRHFMANAISMLVGALLVWGMTWLINWNDRILLENGITDGVLKHLMIGLEASDLLNTQISVSFIVISLTSILSSNSKRIYWTDKIELTLVKSIFGSFSAYTTYIFVCLAFSIIWAVSGTYSANVGISFWCSILVMARLTFKMIEVYFGDGDVKQILEWNYEWMYTQPEAKDELEETRQKMVTIMSQNMRENDFFSFFENFSFIYKIESDLPEKENIIKYESLYQIIQVCVENNIVLAEQIYTKLKNTKQHECEYPNLIKNAKDSDRILEDIEKSYARREEYFNITNDIAVIKNWRDTK